MPFDVVKTQQQITLGRVSKSNLNEFKLSTTTVDYNQSKTILNYMRFIVKSNGVSSLFAG